MKLLLPTIASVVLLSARGADALDFTIPGVCYTSRKGPPGGADSANCKTAAEVQNDINTIKTVANKVRITSLGDCNQGELVLAAAQRSGLKVHVGLLTSSNFSDYTEEKAKLTQFIDSGLFGSQVSAVSVGLNGFSRGVNISTTAETIYEIQLLLRNRGMKIPVTTDDTLEAYNEYELSTLVDIRSITYYAFWEEADVDKAVALTLKKIKSLHSDPSNTMKGVMLAETGWSSKDADSATGLASPENQAKFYLNLYKTLTENNIDYNWFTAFDSNYDYFEIQRNFGLFTVDNQLKSHIKALKVTP